MLFLFYFFVCSMIVFFFFYVSVIVSVSTMFIAMSSFYHPLTRIRSTLTTSPLIDDTSLKIIHNYQLFGKLKSNSKQPWIDFKNHFRINNNWCNQLLTNQSTDSIPSTPHKFRTPPYSPPSPLTNALSPLGIFLSMFAYCQWI